MPKKIKLKKTLKSFDKIDVVDALDCLIMSYAHADIKCLSDEVKGYHMKIAQLLRKDIYKSIKLEAS